jgi:hypothetical protein
MVGPLEIIKAAAEEVNGGEHDSFGTFTVVGDEGLWIQYTPGAINAHYPFEDSPSIRLAALGFDELMEWTPMQSATVEHFWKPAEVAVWIDRYFREILGCAASYNLAWKREH